MPVVTGLTNRNILHGLFSMYLGADSWIKQKKQKQK